MNKEEELIDRLIDLAFAEDIGDGDHTTLSCIPATAMGKSKLLIKEPGILAGIEIAKEVFRRFDPTMKVEVFINDGTAVKPGDVAMIVEGKIQSLLQTERLMLNIMQRMSGIATMTHKYAEQLKGTNTRVLDTRKTTPGMRILEKMAVKIGGGVNHRIGLFDMILLKDNHVDFAGGIDKAINRAKEYCKGKGKDLKIEIEVRNFDELQQVLDLGGVDRIMFDNFTPAMTKKAVEMVGGRYETESSGGITFDTLRDYAYGTSRRVDAVKYNGHYYVARVDAGNGFQNHVPTDTAYWNDFGAEFESIATNLLLAEGANIGDWFMSGGKIVSTLLDGNKVVLDASMARILIESSRSGGDYSESQYQGSKITIDANNGLIEARSKSNSRVAYMSPTGIFCNNAETQAVSAVLGYTHKAAIVGLGFGTVNKSNWNNENFLAGVYGRASNSGTAPAYGGFFQNLMAAGLFLHRKAVEESSSSVYLSETDSLVIGYSRNQQIVYLPSDGVIGRTIFFKQWWTGYMRVYPRNGNVLYDDSSQNDYYDIGEGQGAIFHFTIGYVNGVKKSAWLVSRYKF